MQYIGLDFNELLLNFSEFFKGLSLDKFIWARIVVHFYERIFYVSIHFRSRKCRSSGQMR
ncbi:hypothetical protein XJ74_00955 [Campylobacter coli]|nr:hypothetical protein [Campylobacter coli]